MNKEKFCVFLRGINVNGIKIKMETLKDAFIKMGFDEVKTVLATGNAIISLTTLTGNLNLKKYIEVELSSSFNYDAHVIIRNIDEIREILKASQSIEWSENFNLYVLLCESEEVTKELETLFKNLHHSTGENVRSFKTELFWLVSKGHTLDSEFGSKVLGSKKFKQKFTSRNINTIEKILLSGKDD